LERVHGPTCAKVFNEDYVEEYQQSQHCDVDVARRRTRSKAISKASLRTKFLFCATVIQRSKADTDTPVVTDSVSYVTVL